jgi:hypothetical protein
MRAVTFLQRNRHCEITHSYRDDMQFLVFCLDVDGRVLLKWMLMRSFGEMGVDWINRAEDVGKWRTFVNMVMNSLFH